MEFKNPHRSKIEHVLVIVVVLVVGFLVSANIYYQRLDTKQRSLYFQLQMIRSGINLFKVVEKRNPENLIELAKGVYSFPGDRETSKFLTNVPFDKKGDLVDPFEHVYFYDNKTGWVRSGTNGYEMW